MTRRILACGACFCILLTLLLTPLLGHPGNISYSVIEVEGGSVHQELKILAAELVESLELDTDGDGTLAPEELSSGRDRLDSYLEEKVQATVDGIPLPQILESVHLKEDEVTDASSATFLVATIRFEHSTAIDNLVMRCRILDEVDERHDNFAKITIGGLTRPFLFTTRNEFKFGESTTTPTVDSSLETVVSFGTHGFHHILQGYDHLLFLLGLLVVATNLRMTVGIVTAFTLGHSVSLALAALQIVAVPRSLLECAIALTIMWVAAENVFSWFPFKRWMLSLGFGLIHGLAFAETLDILGLPITQLLLALFSFNVGIEIAQVAVVMIAIPFTLQMAEKKWHLQAVRAISLFIFAFATFWFVQRIIPLIS